MLSQCFKLCARGVTLTFIIYVLAAGSVLSLIFVGNATSAPKSHSASSKLPKREIQAVSPNPFVPGDRVSISLDGTEDYEDISVTFNGEPSPYVHMSGGDVYATSPHDLPPGSPIEIIVSGPIQPLTYTARTRQDYTAPIIIGASLLGAALMALFALLKVRQNNQLLSQLHQSQAQLDQTRFDFTNIAAGTNKNRAATILPIPNIPPELLEACLSRNIILLFGAGMSVQAGFPSWKELLAQLIAKTRDSNNTLWAEDALTQVAMGRYEFALNAVLSRSSHDQLAEWLREIFEKNTEQQENVVKALRRIPLAGAVTCTFDDTAELVLQEQNIFSREELTCFDASMSLSYSELLRDDKPYLFRLFGDLRNPSSLLFSERELRDRLDLKPELRRFIASLFASRCVFLVGMSASKAFELISALGIREKAEQKHFALVPYESGIDIISENCAQQYNLELCPFVATSGYPEAIQFLSSLAQRIDDRGGPRVYGPHLKTFKIDAITLTNIGPFGSATFDLSHDWTLILANNGCGKSTVLRSIAIALAGDEAEAQNAGLSLLKAGCTRGSIELKAGRLTYTTTLERAGDHVHANSPLVSPIKAAGIMILGFPALRGFRDRAVVPSPKKTNSKPALEDILPLIRSAPDPRGSDINQWIVNAYIRSQDSQLSSDVRSAYSALLTKWFEVIDDLVPGFGIRFHGCNTETFEITVETLDGVISMDNLSQGMIATISWAGLILQRLYEVFSRSACPELEHGIVLIDEIDSHLHPAWQRLLVPALRKHFPNLQVIASTHSPLLVGNMNAGELIRIRRADHGLEIEPIRQDYQGYRADQILTDNAFELASTRDVRWEGMRSRFSELVSKVERTENEEQERLQLAFVLNGMPGPQETAVERESVKILRAVLEKSLESEIGDDTKRQRLMEEAQLYLHKVSH